MRVTICQSEFHPTQRPPPPLPPPALSFDGCWWLYSFISERRRSGSVTYVAVTAADDCGVQRSCLVAVTAVDWHTICFVCLYLLCPAGSCWFVPSGHYVLLSQCCPMERVLISGTRKAPFQAGSTHPSLLCLHHPSVCSMPFSGKAICSQSVLWITGMFLCVNSDHKMDNQRQRLSSVVAADLLPSLEGVELGAFGKVNASLTQTSVL